MIIDFICSRYGYTPEFVVSGLPAETVRSLTEGAMENIKLMAESNPLGMLGGMF